MRQRLLGPSGIAVSVQCLGTMTFGAETDQPAAHELLDAYLDAGGTFIDTADVYQMGTAEEITGAWLAKGGRRESVVLATKARFRMGDGPNDVGLSRMYLQRAVEASLRRLRTDHIDLYQAHCWDPAVPVEETLGAFDDLVRAGKVRAVGVSNFTGWQLQRAVLTARHRGLAAVASLQPQYNLLAREVEWDLGPLCRDEGLAMLPWSPLGGGWLAGKYQRDAGPGAEGTRLGDDPARGVEAWEKRDTDRTWAIVDVVRAVAEERSVTPAEIALAWVQDAPGVTSTILGTRTMEQLESNLAAADLELTVEERRRLDDVSAPPTPEYPYGFITEMSADRQALVDG